MTRDWVYRNGKWEQPDTTQTEPPLESQDTRSLLERVAQAFPSLRDPVQPPSGCQSDEDLALCDRMAQVQASAISESPNCHECPHLTTAHSGREPWVTNWYVCGLNRGPALDPWAGVPEWCPLKEANDD